MKTAVDVFKVILKFGVSNITENELGKELAAVFTENGIDKIENSIIQGRSQIECVLSRENLKSMNISEEYIDFIIAEIKELLSKIEITGEIFRQCKYDSSNLEDFLWKEYSENKNSYIEYENEIKRALFAITEVLIKLMRESDGFENEALIHISNTVDDIKVEMREGFNSFHETQKDNMQNNESDTNIQEKKIQNNKKQYYIKKWNSRLFLHVDNNERPITLEEAFIMPDYKMYSQIERIKFSETDNLGDVINKFVEYDATSSMLITGVPGIGKTSITAWMANEFKDDEDVIILRFRDWEGEELREGLLKTICNTIKCDKMDLENKILILDGFDEMKFMNDRDSLLNTFLNDLWDFYNFKIIITSRPNYIDLYKFQNAFELLTFNVEKVSRFYQLIKNQKLEECKIDCYNLKVIGIPVILYMAIMCDIDLTQKATKPELYNRIFAEKGGIFDKFYFEGNGYDVGDQVFRNVKNASKYLKFLRKVAFKMFERNNLKLRKWECEIPKLNFHGEYIKIIEFPIKHIFENISENIEFIHQSIYEYFVSEYIYDSFYKSNNISKTNLMCSLGKLFKKNVLTHEILEFLRYKINNSELKNLFHDFYEAFEIMLFDGMIYYTGKCYKNCIICEMKVFTNMIEILHLWEDNVLEFGGEITEYLKYNTRNNLNLRKVNMNRINLKGVDLKGVDLQGANITDANLERANLYCANLKDAKLIGVDLERADLQGANLVRTNLQGANLKYAHLEASRWTQSDITKALSQLKNTEFNYIIVEDQEFKRVYRNELFDNEG